MNRNEELNTTDRDLIIKSLNLMAEEALKKYKEIMKTVVDDPQPITDKTLKEFHDKTKIVVLKSYEELFDNMSSEFEPLVKQQQLKLEESLKAQLPTDLKRYEVNMERVVRKIKQCSIIAENHYDDLIRGFAVNESTREAVVTKHEEARIGALRRFEEAIQLEGLDLQEVWQLELELKLNERLQDLLQEARFTSKDVGADGVEEVGGDAYSFRSRPAGPILKDGDISKGLKLQDDEHKGAGLTPSNLLPGVSAAYSTPSKFNPCLPVDLNRTLGHDPGDLPQADDQGSHPVTPAVDVGIYFDRTSEIIVGRLDPKTSSLQVVIETTRDIAFLENKVLIGAEAAKFKTERNHADISNLENTGTTFFRGSSSFHMSKFNIIFTYFMKLKLEVGRVLGCTSIRNAVITIPHATTSTERKYIKMVAKRVFGNVRIISTLLATAITYASHCQFYRQDEASQKPQFVFVAQSLCEGFSMALIEICREGIISKLATTSKNLGHCENYDFVHTHSKLFTNERIVHAKHQELQKIYKQAVEILYSRGGPGGTSVEAPPLIIGSQGGFEEFYRILFPNKPVDFFDLKSGPLTGACIFAERDNPRLSNIPAEIQVLDRSWTTFTISIEKIQAHSNLKVFPPNYGEVEMEKFNNSAFSSNETVFPPLQIIEGSLRLVLQERFRWDNTDHRMDVDVHYFIGINAKERHASVILKSDEDGILSLVVDEVSINS